jgi:hypothetical protein
LYTENQAIGCRKNCREDEQATSSLTNANAVVKIMKSKLDCPGLFGGVYLSFGN